MMRTRPITFVGTLIAAAGFTLGTGTKAFGSDTALAKWSSNVWTVATQNESSDALELLQNLPTTDTPDGAELASAIERFKLNIEKRETDRQTRLTELRDELLGYPADMETKDALTNILEQHTIALDKQAVLGSPETLRIVKSAATKAADLEADGDWLGAHSLFNRLNLLFEEQTTYRDDLERLNRRLLMLRLYVPERLHELRSAERVREGDDALPPYNDLGDRWQDKVVGISDRMIIQSLLLAQQGHVEGNANLHTMVRDGINAVRLLVTTSDLARTFPSLANNSSRDRFLRYLKDAEQYVDSRERDLEIGELLTVVRGILKDNDETLQLPATALLHEFGTGAMQSLDEHTAIIWPHDLEEFNRTTRGEFYGVGIQISLNDALELEVVSPLAGTPASAAGIRAKDKITHVDGQATFGIGLQQAVDRITGPEGSPVVLTISREGLEEPMEVTLSRAKIPVFATKGWERTGPGELDWNYYVDEQSKIAYVRLTQFNRNTTKELRQIIGSLGGERGINGMILDVRYNPGGLLTEAVNVSNLFIESGRIVTQEDKFGAIAEEHTASRGRALLSDVPLAVLVNGGSASASEIVAGALQDYGRAVIVGEQTFGKGSVQNVIPLRGTNPLGAFKLTTHYYKLPSGRSIHRSDAKPRSEEGVTPNIVVEMLPEQVSDWIVTRRDADLASIDVNGNRIIPQGEEVHPDVLLEKGLDPQLETALLLLRVQMAGIDAIQLNEQGVVAN